MTDRKEQLEADLAQVTAKLRTRQTLVRQMPIELNSAIPRDVTLIDFLEYTHFSPPAEGKGEMKRQRHLVAFVVRPDRPIEQIDLGPVAPIAQAIDAWRVAFAGDRSTEKPGPTPGAESDADKSADYNSAEGLRRLIWDPLESHIVDARTVLVSPDGALARFPIAALPGKKAGTFLIEEVPIAIVAVPQMLPEMVESREMRVEGKNGVGDSGSEHSTLNAQPSLLLIGDVDYGAAPGGPPTPALLAAATPDAKDSPGTSSDAAASAAILAFTPRSAARGNGRMTFDRLPATAQEVQEIESLWQSAYSDASPRLVRGTEPTEQTFRELAPAYRYLHVATHGFFASPDVKSALDHLTDSAGFTRAGLDASDPNGSVSGWHIGRLSGLALAGANRGGELTFEQITDSKQIPDDGIVTAMELAELDLSHTDLVMLSACETGLGRVAGGEGILGLQRAFQVAGARSVVASLWKVDDEITRLLMTEFYRNLWEKKLPKLEALRQAQLHILRHGPGDSSHPRYWAAWVLSGDPGDLKLLSGTLASNHPAEVSSVPGNQGTLAAEPSRRWLGWSSATWFAASVVLLAMAAGLVVFIRRRRLVK